MSYEVEAPLETQTPEFALLSGTVLAVQANYYWVRLDDPAAPAAELLCTRRTRLKKIGQQVMVGDRVQVEEPDWAGKRGAIARVLPRHTELDRPPIANVDQILLVFALEEPTLDPFQLSRFLVKAESTSLTVLLGLNKSDLATPEAQAEWRDRLQTWGYEPVLLSLRSGMGLDQLHACLNQQITVVSGPSGVGKSSLTNYLIPAVEQRIGEVSGKLSRGRHTTRHVELFELPTGGLLADTPGFNQPDLNCAPIDLAQYFPEARQRLAEATCQFSNCLHRDEPNCAVRGDWERYEHYLVFLDEVIDHQTAINRTGDAESTTKTMTSGDGQVRSEPKLASKKYRRPSRRTEKQVLKDLCDDVEELMAED
ncbi:small ribosomal subunit biogenesis GTPase RsgA [Phormidium tenue FACHB-886]|nr:small ribosomal subunit biogenesis GTPase RsgA [Phormidium tenue FACHB-886]